MAEEKKNDQVNVDLDPTKYPGLLSALDKMVAGDFSDRSKFIRKLIRDEEERRAQLPLPSPFPQPAPKKRSAEPEAPVAA